MKVRIPGAKDYGHYQAICCPYHDDNNPSMLVFEKHAICLACGKRVRIEKLLRDLQLSNPILLKQSERVAVLPIRNYANLYIESLSGATHPFFLAYIQERKIERASAFFRLGFLPDTGHVTIPIYLDHRSDFVGGIFLRAIYENNFTRYQYKTNSPVSFYPNPSSKATGIWFVTFGAFDALSIWECGFNAITTMTKKVSNSAIEVLANFIQSNDFVLYFVPDYGEEHEAYQYSSALGVRTTVRVLSYMEGMKDPNDLHRKGLLQVQLEGGLPKWLR